MFEDNFLYFQVTLNIYLGISRTFQEIFVTFVGSNAPYPPSPSVADLILSQFPQLWPVIYYGFPLLNVPMEIYNFIIIVCALINIKIIPSTIKKSPWCPCPFSNKASDLLLIAKCIHF